MITETCLYDKNTCFCLKRHEKHLIDRMRPSSHTFRLRQHF